MNKILVRTSFAAVGGLLALGMGATAFAANPSSGPGWGGNATVTPTLTASTPSMSDAVKADLVFSRDEERMARDLYAAIADLYDGALPFAHITTSEQRHFDAVGVLLDRYGLADPAEGKAPGVYANSDIQAMYDSWLARAKTSLTEAYQVGIELEQRDIADLEDAAANALPADVARVLGNLLDGSQRHLKSFTSAAEGTYEPGGADPQAGAGPSGQPESGNGFGGRGGQQQNGRGPGLCINR